MYVPIGDKEESKLTQASMDVFLKLCPEFLPIVEKERKKAEQSGKTEQKES